MALPFGQPGRAYYATELIGLAGSGSGAVQRELARLGRPVIPTILSRKELAKRLKSDNAFVQRVLFQPKFWLIGSQDDLGD